MTEKDIIHKLTYLLHGHRRKIFIIFGCLLISTGLNLCIPFISKEIMDEGFIGGNKNILLYLVVGSFAIYTGEDCVVFPQVFVVHVIDISVQDQVPYKG